MKKIIQGTFWQLLVIYVIAVSLISFNLFWKYTLHFEILALAIGTLAVLALNKERVKRNINKNLHYALLITGILFILILRILPYWANAIPLGYDAGIYKYGIESFVENGHGVDEWIKGAFTPGFLYLMFALEKIFGSEFILIWLFILFNLILGGCVYFCTKEYFGKQAGVIAFLLYASSVIQFKVFSFMYYKNILGLIFMLWALIFLRKKNRVWFVVFGVLTGMMHRPTFFIFGLSYMAFTIYNQREWRKNVRDGVLILILTGIGYIGFFKFSILPLIYPIAESFIIPGTSPGTFISFFTYQFSTLAYLPFAILGFGSLISGKKFNILFFWTLINGIVVYFQFFFFNRFIIHLDIVMIVLAGVGFSIIIKNKKKTGIVILIIMLFSAGFVAFNESKNAEAGISKSGLEMIKSLKNVEKDAEVIALSSEYSPYVLAYSGRKTIAPGLFEENKWDKKVWNKFWASENKEETREMLRVYGDVPLYLFAGTKRFNNPCFALYSEDDGWKIYKYGC